MGMILFNVADPAKIEANLEHIKGLVLSSIAAHKHMERQQAEAQVGETALPN